MCRNTRFTAIFLAINVFNGVSSYAQCAMCRAAIETEGNSSKAEALNDGIVYLMIMPYVLVGIIAYIIYRMRKNKSV